MHLVIEVATANAIIEALTASAAGRAGLLLGRDIEVLNKVTPTTENDIIEQHQVEKRRKEQDGENRAD